MKNGYVALISTIILASFNGSEKSFNPTKVFDYPDIHPDSIAKIEKQSIEYNRILKEKIPYDDWTKAQRKLMLDEHRLSEHPFYTGPFGCS